MYCALILVGLKSLGSKLLSQKLVFEQVPHVAGHA